MGKAFDCQNHLTLFEAAFIASECTNTLTIKCKIVILFSYLPDNLHIKKEN